MDSPAVVEKRYLVPFILVTTLFALWGFANDITNPLVAVFKDVFVINNAQSSWVQMAFYGGYATMAIPAALFIRKFSYKTGILIGLGLYALGAFISIPAASGANFNLFIVALYVITFGLAFLETTANPYILSMGDPKTATQRLNLAQAFNPIGSLSGMFIAVTVILSSLQVEDFKTDVGTAVAERIPAKAATEHKILPFLKAKPRELKRDANAIAYVDAAVNDIRLLAEVKDAGVIPTAGFNNKEDLEKLNEEIEGVIDSKVESLKSVGRSLVHFKDGKIDSYQGLSHGELQKADLKIVSTPYVVIGIIVIAVFIVFLVMKMPDTGKADEQANDPFKTVLKRLLNNPRYTGGVVAQTFYVAAQIMIWTFIIQYAENELGIDKATAQNHNIMAMVIFLLSRFICTAFLKYISPGAILLALGIAATVCTLGAIHLSGMAGLYSLVAISACMSLMFPTIYGLALDGTGSDAKLGSAGLILAIVGGAIMPRLQAEERHTRILEKKRY